MDEQDLERLFDRWRDWSYLNNFGLGYKKVTVEHRLMVEGIVIRSKHKQGRVVDDPDCERLDAIVAQLPPKMKKAIVMKYLHGFINKDLAKALHVSVATIKRSLARYRKIILQRIDDH